MRRMVMDIQIGDIVETRYYSGTYIGKVLQDKRNYWLVEVLAVVVQPTQGDLHNRGQVEGVAFHERKALAFREKTNARKRDTVTFAGEVPDYVDSLKEAVANMKADLAEEDTAFNQLSLERIADLEAHFYDKIFKA